jgi:hypothetical protein
VAVASPLLRERARPPVLDTARQMNRRSRYRLSHGPDTVMQALDLPGGRTHMTAHLRRPAIALVVDRHKLKMPVLAGLVLHLRFALWRNV